MLAVNTRTNKTLAVLGPAGEGGRVFVDIDEVKKTGPAGDVVGVV